MIRTPTLFLIGLTALLAVSAEARLRSVTMSEDQDYVAPRWMFDAKAKVVGPQIVSQLVAIKRAQLAKNYEECAQLARKAAATSAAVRPWIAYVELDCAYKLAGPEGKQIAPLKTVLKVIDDHPKWLLNGPTVSLLKPLYLESMVALFERQVKLERRAAWSTYDVLQPWKKDLSGDQEARIYRSAGELAFLEQNLNLAIDFFSRSLNERESADVRRRLESVKASVFKKEEKAEVSAAADLVSRGEEREIMSRMDTAVASGDLLSAVQDGVKVIEKFPGSGSAKAASDRVLDIYLSIASKSEKNFISIREKAIDSMLAADSARLYRWANNAYVKSYYPDAQRLAEAAIQKFAGHPDSTKAILLAAHAALYNSDFSAAKKWYTRLVESHSGSDEAKDALFRLGLIEYRDKKWLEASAYFERLLSIAPQSDSEYLALHWHWRAQQKLKAEQADKIAERLMNRYPLTYYGLRARAELNGGVLKFDIKSAPKGSAIKSDVWMSETQGQSWERLQLLLKAGWYDEAQKEIEFLPEPQSNEDKVVRARLLAAAFNHYESVRLINEVWTNQPEIWNWTQTRTAFAKEFEQATDKEGKANQLDPLLVRSLIRQESTFKIRAVSSANAHGVMQVLPATAQEVAQSNKWKAALVLPNDLFNPEVNIRIGTIYLGRMVRAFKGHVPLALASYNAGIGRMRRWLAARKDLGDIESRVSSNPDDEIWIDELPWDETSSYVKAILRNLLIYQLMESNELKLPEPLWQSRRS